MVVRAHVVHLAEHFIGAAVVAHVRQDKNIHAPDAFLQHASYAVVIIGSGVLKSLFSRMLAVFLVQNQVVYRFGIEYSTRLLK